MIRYLMVFVASLLVSCAGRRGASLSAKKVVRSGTFTIKSDEVSGSGSIIHRVLDDRSQIILYSPFGQKLYQLDLIGDSLNILNDGESPFKVSVKEPVGVLGIDGIPELSSGEFFEIIAGIATDDIQDVLNKNTQDVMSVKKRRGEIVAFTLNHDGMTFSMNRYHNAHFRDIKLEISRRNYFHILYE